MKKKCNNVFLVIGLLFFSLLLFPEKVSSASTTVYGGVDYSPVYDYEYYIAHNPDVASAFHGDVSKTLQHFVECGMDEGRRASASFDVRSYYLRYSDLRRAFGKNWKKYYLHYINHGRKENRVTTGITKMMDAVTSLNGVDYSAVYDYQYYIDHNPDVAKYYGDDDMGALQHFVACGMNEGRRASASFDVDSYYLRYSDLRRAFGKNWKEYYLHYINHGRKENRVATGVTKMVDAVTSLNGVNYSAVYDYQYYIDHNPDVAKYYGDDDMGALQHFAACGMNEGRRASASFDVDSYYLRYSDLRRAFGKNWKEYYLHYINHGRKENRVATGVTKMVDAVTSLNGVNYSAVYDYQYYIEHNPDVAKYYGDDDMGVLCHFVTCGMSEGRQASSKFNVTIYRSNYPDLQKAYGANLMKYYLHYIYHGKNEGRDGANPTHDCNGWCVISGEKYYYQNGVYCTGLKIINGRAYYFSSSGVLSSQFGIDVSSHQGEINWEKVKNDGIEFAMIRIGYGSDDTEQDDPYGARNISECKRLGIPYGVYLFSYAMDDKAAASEAQHILRLLNGDHPPLGVYLDVESNTYWSGKGFDPKQKKDIINNNVRIVMDTLKSNGYSGQTGIYANPDFIRNVLDSSLFTNNKRWLANYRSTLPDYSFDIWQYSNGEGLTQISGISKNVDRDLIIIHK
jgi:GH25 family lysozyme M1 (1,4-beta-N-acetylmuramidase)